MQQALMKDLENRLRANMNAMSPENMVNTWFPASMQGAEQLQKMFWGQVQSMLSGVTNTTSAMVNFTERDRK
jgi:hypothetical protein